MLYEVCFVLYEPPVINGAHTQDSHNPLPQKRPHIEKYYPFLRYKIKPTNDSECTKFHFDSHLFACPFKTDVVSGKQLMGNKIIM